MKWLFIFTLLFAGKAFAFANDAKPAFLIGYTESRNDLPSGQYLNWVTSRACLVNGDGTGRRVLAEELTVKPNSWTQFAGWSPDGKKAIIGSHWESPENAAWEREHKTFRMTEGWLSDACLCELSSGKIENLTAIDRVSIYNTGLFFLPDGSGYGFTPLINGISKPFIMNLDGRNKRDVSAQGGGFAYGYSASPDGKRISYHENYQIYVSNLDGSQKQKIETGNAFNFGPSWSPNGEWLMFVSGEHYNCHPYIVKRDGSGLRKLADRGGYRGVMERLKYQNFIAKAVIYPFGPAIASQSISPLKSAKRSNSIGPILTGELSNSRFPNLAYDTTTLQFRPMASGFCSVPIAAACNKFMSQQRMEPAFMP